MTVTLESPGGPHVMRVRTTVGGPVAEDATDLGEVTPGDASAWLTGVAVAGDGKASEDAILPAVLARDAVTWPSLARMAKDQGLRAGTRRQAIFWLGQEAADQAVGPLDDLITDDPDRELRRQAYFWLGQSEDPRGIQLFEKVMAGR